jgi:hypothetical protein
MLLSTPSPQPDPLTTNPAQLQGSGRAGWGGDCTTAHLPVDYPRQRPEGLRSPGNPRKPPPHLLGSKPLVPRSQESHIGSRRARSREHMALLLWPRLGGIRSSPATEHSTRDVGIPALPHLHPPRAFPSDPSSSPVHGGLIIY